MTTLPTRYAIGLFALLLPALLAGWAYSYGGLRSDDCLDSSALFETAWIEGVQSSEDLAARRWPWLFQGIAGTVATKAPGISGLKFRILRSFEPERLYEDPLRILSPSRQFASARPTLEWLVWRSGGLPIHEAIVEEPGGARIGAYMFLYESRAVANPLLTLLRAVPRRIATGPRPLTLVTVSAYSSIPLRDAARQLMRERLLSVWQHYLSVCRI